MAKNELAKHMHHTVALVGQRIAVDQEVHGTGDGRDQDAHTLIIFSMQIADARWK